jgi:hypothetical protein
MLTFLVEGEKLCLRSRTRETCSARGFSQHSRQARSEARQAGACASYLMGICSCSYCKPSFTG